MYGFHTSLTETEDQADKRLNNADKYMKHC